MLTTGPAKRVAIHLNEDAASEGDYLYREIISFLFTHGISGATVLRGYLGFGSHHRIHTQGAPAGEGEHLPLRIEFLESEAKVKELMPKLIRLVSDGIIEVQETSIVHVAQPVRTAAAEDHGG